MKSDNDEDIPEFARVIPAANVRVNDRDLSVLPGSFYQKLLMPLDYPPSRKLQPRWGASHPVHEGIASLFKRDEANYRELIADLRGRETQLAAISRDFRGDGEAGWIGGAMNPMDLAMIYLFVCKYKPARFIEIGSGISTTFARRAVRDNSLSTKIFSIDPEPRSAIDAICDEVLREGLETLPSMSIFEELTAGDIVFLDGSHRSFMNSDVTVFMLDVLPRLKPGVIVQIHDIHLPFDYPGFFQYWYWNEQYIVAAYLLAAPEKVHILMPCRYVGATAELANELIPPPAISDSTHIWRDGGSLWFTKA